MAQPNSSKSDSVSICRFFFVAFLLVVLPLFPSQAPEPFNQTILANLWELLHLLFIGITVAYGLFGRKSSEIDNPIESRSENFQPFLSGISHVSRFFENNSGNLSGYVEKRATQPWNLNSQFKANVPETVVLEKWENQNPRSLIFADGSSEKIVSRTWNSRYFHGQSVVVVANEKGDIDESGKSNPISVINNKPLGLPVRKLMTSRNEDHVCDNNYSRPSSIGSFKSVDSRRNGKVRGLTPINLEDKFKETVALRSPVPRRSRSKGDDMGGVKPAGLHKRPLSVGAFDQLDYLQSQSFWSPIFSETNPVTSPAKEVSHAPHNLPKSEEGSIMGDEFFCEFPQRVSAGSEMNLEGNSDVILKNRCRSMRKNPHGRGKLKVDRSLIDTNHVNDGSPRGNSVRPFRSKEHEAEDEKMDKKQNHERLHPSDLLEERQNEDKERSSDTNAVEFGTYFEMKLEDSELSSEERQEEEELAEGEIVNSNADVDGHDGEVDRKAGEFIAKFREQIRLQKVASSRGFGGC